MTDLRIFGQTFTNVAGIKATDTDGNEVVYGGGYSFEEIVTKTQPSGAIDLTGIKTPEHCLQYFGSITRVQGKLAEGSRTYMAFANMAGLTSACIIAPNPVNYGHATFIDSSNLVTAVFITSENTEVQNLFNGCRNLERADILVKKLRTNTFYNCSKCNLIVLRKSSSICELENLGAINMTAFKNGGAGGEIYIPKVLYDHLGDGSALDYKSASNWATIDGYGTITWKQIEGSIYETQYADGTPIE